MHGLLILVSGPLLSQHHNASTCVDDRSVALHGAAVLAGPLAEPGL